MLRSDVWCGVDLVLCVSLFMVCCWLYRWYGVLLAVLLVWCVVGCVVGMVCCDDGSVGIFQSSSHDDPLSLHCSWTCALCCRRD